MFFLRGPRVSFFAVGPCAATSPQTLARAPLQPIRSRYPLLSACVASTSVANPWNWSFGHEVKIQELDQFHLHLAAGGTGFEERSDGKQAVERFERTRVGGVLQEGSDEGEQGDRLDGRAGGGVKKVEEELLKDRQELDFAEES